MVSIGEVSPMSMGMMQNVHVQDWECEEAMSPKSVGTGSISVPLLPVPEEDGIAAHEELHEPEKVSKRCEEVDHTASPLPLPLANVVDHAKGWTQQIQSPCAYTMTERNISIQEPVGHEMAQVDSASREPAELETVKQCEEKGCLGSFDDDHRAISKSGPATEQFEDFRSLRQEVNTEITELRNTVQRLETELGVASEEKTLLSIRWQGEVATLQKERDTVLMELKRLRDVDGHLAKTEKRAMALETELKQLRGGGPNKSVLMTPSSKVLTTSPIFGKLSLLRLEDDSSDSETDDHIDEPGMLEHNQMLTDSENDEGSRSCSRNESHCESLL